MSFEGTVSGKTIKVASRGQEQAVIELQWTGDAPPLPFTEEAIELRNGEVKLGGDLLLQPGPGPHPAIVAAQSNDIAFVIEVSPSGVSFAELHISAQEHTLRSRGFSDHEVSEATDALRRLNDFVRKGDPQGAQPMLEGARRKRWFEFSALPSAPPTEKELRTSIRWRDLDFDPVYYRERVKIPVLLIFGERERLVPVDRSVKRIREAFRRAGNTRYKIKVFPGADHGISLAPNPATSEKGSVGANEGPTFAPGFFDTMTEWLREKLELAR